MSYCPSCGSKAAADAKFCSECGASLTGQSTPTSERDKGSMYERTNLGIPPEVSADFFSQIILDFCERKIAAWEADVNYLANVYGENWRNNFNLSSKEPAVPRPDELDLLTQDIDQLRSIDRDFLIDLHNFCVSVIRSECLKDVKEFETVRVRPDLELPKAWHAHYENMFDAQLPFLILAVVQHAFIGNPLAGELNEWSNRNAFFGKAKTGSKGKLAGAAAIGAAAALLLGS